VPLVPSIGWYIELANVCRKSMVLAFFLFQKQTKYQWRFDGQPKKEIETPGCNDTSINIYI
jgi:hypothetical protein